MALVKNYLMADAPRPRRGHVGWTSKQKAYFTGGYTEVSRDRISGARRSQLLHDIHCLDLPTMTWMTECPFPEPPDFLDGHTASLVGTRLYLIAGGTYPEGHNPNQNFALACSAHVYILETDPPCNADGSIPPLVWRKLKLVQETQEDIEAGNHWDLGEDDDFEEEEEFQPDEREEDEEEIGEAENPDIESDSDFSEDSADLDPNDLGNDLQDGWQQIAEGDALPQGGAGAAPSQQPINAPVGLPGIHPTIARALNAAGEGVRRLLPAFAFGRNDHGQGGADGANFGPLAAAPQQGDAGRAHHRHRRAGSGDANGAGVDGDTAIGQAASEGFLRPRVWHSATVVGTRIYIMGGRDMHLRYFDDMTYFDTVTETFVRIRIPHGAPKPPARAAHGAVCPDNRHIYIFGGRYKYPMPQRGLTHRHYNDVWVFDTRNGSWKCLIDPPEGDTEKYKRTPVQDPRYRLATDYDNDGNNDDDDDEAADDEDEADDNSEGKNGGTSKAGKLENRRKHKSTDAAAAPQYPAPRCCFLMVLDPALPHKAHIVGGYTSSNVCFYYLGDSWTLDLLTLSWTPMTFLDGSDHLNRVSIHTPTCFYDELVLFAGEGSEEVMEVPYGSQQFLPHTTIFTVPETPLADVLKYRDPVAYNYFLLRRREDLSDVTIETPNGGSFKLHRIVVAARMKHLNQLLSARGKWTMVNTSLTASFSLRSSQKFTVKTCTVSSADWETFLVASMPQEFFSIFHRTFDQDVLTQAFLFAYTDTIHQIHRVSLDHLVQLYHLGFILDLRRLSAVALSQISDRLDPYFPHRSDMPLIDEMLASSVHFGAEIPLLDTLIWYRLNSATIRSSSSSNGLFSQSMQALTILPTIILPVHNDMSKVVPGRDLLDIANVWLARDGPYASLSASMDALCASPDDADADFELQVPAASSGADDDNVDEPSTASSSSQMDVDGAAYPSTSQPTSDPIRVHKSILIFSSPYLKALLSNDFKESQQGFAIVQDLPYPMERSSLAALIRFMYGGSFKHIQDKNMALDILCNVQFFYSQHQELSKPIPHLGQKSTRLLRPRSLETELMAHCIDIVLSGEVTSDEIAGLLSLSHTLGLLHFEQRLNKRLRGKQSDSARATSSSAAAL